MQVYVTKNNISRRMVSLTHDVVTIMDFNGQISEYG